MSKSKSTSCRSCGRPWEAAAFYASDPGRCKDCTCAAVRANRRQRIDHYREYDVRRNMDPRRVAARVAYARSEHGRVVVRAVKERWAERNHYKRRAQYALNNALRDGRAQRSLCEKCGAKAQAHHEDYTKALDVVWLCPKHHKARHHELDAMRKEVA